jgi:hypothetical protein
MVSLVPLPLGSEIQAFDPSPMTKMLEILRKFELDQIPPIFKVDLPGGEGAVKDVLDVDNIEASDVTLTVGDGTNTSHVAAASDHDEVTSIKLDKLSDLASRDIELDGIVDCMPCQFSFTTSSLDAHP